MQFRLPNYFLRSKVGGVNTRFLSLCCVVCMAMCQTFFAQGVFNGEPQSQTNVALPPAVNPSNGGEATNTVAAPASIEPPETSIAPLVAPAAKQPLVATNPATSGLRTAIMALAAVVILPCLFCAALMVAKENRRAARVCVVAAVIFGAACLLALVVVDSLG
jgi:hypothetical protein